LSFERDRELNRDEESQPGSVKSSQWHKKSISDDHSAVINYLDEKVTEDLDKVINRVKVWSKVEEHKSLAIVLEDFPGGDFQKQIKWTVDNKVYTSLNIEELRTKYVVLVEGAFQKRCRGFRWRKYFGFFLSTGIMVYFREEGKSGMVFKKAVDFRNNTISLPNNEQFRLNVITKERSWLLKFRTRKHLDVWKDAINVFTMRRSSSYIFF